MYPDFQLLLKREKSIWQYWAHVPALKPYGGVE